MVNDLCPRCNINGKTSRLIPIHFTVQDAYYTCEEKNCSYFVTDNRGNPLKFSIATNNSNANLTNSRDDNFLDLDALFETANTGYNTSEGTTTSKESNYDTNCSSNKSGSSYSGSSAENAEVNSIIAELLNGCTPTLK